MKKMDELNEELKKLEKVENSSEDELMYLYDIRNSLKEGVVKQIKQVVQKMQERELQLSSPRGKLY